MTESKANNLQDNKVLEQRQQEQMLNPEKNIKTSEFNRNNFNNMKLQLYTIKESMNNIIKNSNILISTSPKNHVQSASGEKLLESCSQCLALKCEIKRLEDERKLLKNQLEKYQLKQIGLNQENIKLITEIEDLKTRETQQELQAEKQRSKNKLQKIIKLSISDTLNQNIHKKVTDFMIEQSYNIAFDIKEKNDKLQNKKSLKKAAMIRDIELQAFLINNYKTLLEFSNQQILKLNIQKIKQKYEKSGGVNRFT